MNELDYDQRVTIFTIDLFYIVAVDDIQYDIE
jgi:hypothetical protein